MSGAPDPAIRLARAIAASAETAGCVGTVSSIDSRPWTSATYTGARHVVRIAMPASIRRYRWLAGLTVAELDVRGHVALPPAILSTDDDGVLLDIVTLEAH